MSKRWIVSAIMLLSLALGACGKEDITADSIVTKMRESQASITDLHSVVSMTYAFQQDTGSFKAELWTRKTGTQDADGNDISAMRMKVLESQDGAMNNAELVTNGVDGWAYDPETNTAVVGTKADLERMNAAQGQSNGPGGGQMGQMEMLAQLQGVVQMGLDAVDIEILGEEQVAGHNAYKLKITQKKDAQAQQQLPFDLLVETTLWVDSERWMPLKLVVDAKDMGKMEVTADPLDTNTSFDAAMFDAAPPAGATIKPLAEMIDEMEKNGPQPMTLDEAQAQAGFAVLTAKTETAGAALVDVQLITLPQGNTVVQMFAGNGEQWSLVQTQSDFPTGAERQAGNSKDVEVRGVTGKLIENRSSAGTILTWDENGVTFVLAGDLTADEALAVAKGLE